MILAASEAESLSSLHGRCFESRWPAHAFITLCAQPDTILLRTQPCLQAFILFRWTGQEAELLTLCVEPADRRCGLARNLLAQMEAALRKQAVRRVHLEVRADNGAALRLYATANYLCTGRRAGYYKTPSGRIDAVLMSKEL